MTVLDVVLILLALAHIWFGGAALCGAAQAARRHLTHKEH